MAVINMPNVTITVPEELKAEMDKFSEVSWSEICRNAIARYVAARKNPTPQIQLMGKEIHLDPYDTRKGYPGMLIDILIQNNMDFDIVVDRILYTVTIIDESGSYRGVGTNADLYKRVVGANSMGGSQFFLPVMNEKIKSLDRYLKTKTFQCRIDCIVFVEDFGASFHQEVHGLKIPIDEWKDFVKNTVGKGEVVGTH